MEFYLHETQFKIHFSSSSEILACIKTNNVGAQIIRNNEPMINIKGVVKLSVQIIYRVQEEGACVWGVSTIFLENLIGGNP